MNKLVVGIIIAILSAILGGFFLIGNKSTPSSSPEPTLPQESTRTLDTTIRFNDPKKSAHYESNTPEHGSVLVGVPINVVINFNFDLAPPSSISIAMNGKEYGLDETIIDDNKLSMRRKMNPNSPDGVYTVNYNACWPDKTCHDGNFQFKIDRTQSSTYTDLTDKKEVTINLENINFEPKNIRISKGTKITWINQDEVDHYVNTESHPAHTYYPDQNSKALKNGDQFSLVFNQTGIYPYHCSAHANTMMASILVE
ncbi:MAG: plastocyanin/azurin family copper-binding protein [Candidatus Daviesbacteria bacterium]|nr:plastocyanin/azurin family copper-binding protein [Candidatus Daviesbacteria bacterium]